MEYSKENIMTRKEYLKSKKNNKFNFSKLKYLLLFVTIILLGLYVFKQLNLYNNVTKIANKVVEESALLKTMTMYYVSDPYTKDGKTTVMLYKSLDESRTKIENSDNLCKIKILDGVLYGIKEENLYSINLETNEINKVIEDKVTDYVVYNKCIFAFEKGKKSIIKYNILDEKYQKIFDQPIYDLKVDSNNIFVISEGKTSKSILKLDLSGNKKNQISDKEIVSGFILNEDKVFYINSSDSKLYSISKAGGNSSKITDNKISKIEDVIVTDNSIIYINKSDSNTLHQIDLKNMEDKIIVKKDIDGIQIDGNILYYKVKDDLGIYKYNLENKNSEKITSIRSNEFICKN